MTNSLNKSVKVPGDLLYQELSNGELVILNLNKESYYGLDNIGTIMWNEITSTKNIDTAFSNLLEKLDVTPNRLRKDLEIFVNQLIENGILEYS
ncbi:MAG: PqqD family protein [Thermodesulfobacteriota bacterium]